MQKRIISFIHQHQKISLQLTFIITILLLGLGATNSISFQAEGLPQTGIVFGPNLIPDKWHALADKGLNNAINTLWVSGTDLYVGGIFTQTHDGSVTDLGYIARYDIDEDKWYALPNEGLNGYVTALALIGDDLYVGGAFTGTGDGTKTNLWRIARYDTVEEEWYPLDDDGLNNDVFVMIASGSDLYVGGSFTASRYVSVFPLLRIARYDTVAGSWHGLTDKGLNGEPYAMALSGTDLYVGGNFSETESTTVPLTNLGNVTRYDTVAKTWHALKNKGVDLLVYALAVYGNDLYVGGAFKNTGDGSVTDLNYIALYDTAAESWHPLSNQGLNIDVKDIAVSGSDIYIAGQITATYDNSVTGLGYVTRYDTTTKTWNPMPNQGMNTYVWALASSSSDLYVGGSFSQTADGKVEDLNYIARCSLKKDGPPVELEDVYLPLVFTK